MKWKNEATMRNSQLEWKAPLTDVYRLVVICEFGKRFSLPPAVHPWLLNSVSRSPISLSLFLHFSFFNRMTGFELPNLTFSIFILFFFVCFKCNWQVWVFTLYCVNVIEIFKTAKFTSEKAIHLSKWVALTLTQKYAGVKYALNIHMEFSVLQGLFYPKAELYICRSNCVL